MKKKAVLISEDAHMKIRVLAALRGTAVKYLLEDLIEEAFNKEDFEKTKKKKAK